MIFGRAIPIGVFGPSVAVDNAIARFDGTTGGKIQNSAVTINDGGSVNIPEGQAYTVGGAAIPWGQIAKTGSSLADLATRSAGDLSSGNLAADRLPTGGSWALSSDLNINSNSLFIDKETGNVGIGTTSPGALLDVQGELGFQQLWIKGTHSARAGGVRLMNDTGKIATVSLMGSAFGTAVYQNALQISNYDGNAGVHFGKSNFTAQMSILDNGNVGIATLAPTAALHVASDIFRLNTAKTPATSGAAGNAGDICWNSSYIYVCVATNTWKRSSLAAW